MAKREKQVNIRFSKEEYREVETRASDRKQDIPEFLRDLLRFGMLPEPFARR